MKQLLSCVLFTVLFFGFFTFVIRVEPASAADTRIYFSVEPRPNAPLTNLNASINGLETPPTSSPIGMNFTVEIRLKNATAMNAPAGIVGLNDVCFYFGNILNYCKPIGFTSELGQADGALTGSIAYGLSGFYKDYSPEGYNASLPPPYTGAKVYVVAAASADNRPWNGNDGLVANITFQITGQPRQNMSEIDFYAPLEIRVDEIFDSNFHDVPFSVTQGSFRIDRAPANSLIGDLNGDGKVDLVDLVTIAMANGSTPGTAKWNPTADLNGDGKVDIADLVILAIHYGQHYL